MWGLLRTYVATYSYDSVNS